MSHQEDHSPVAFAEDVHTLRHSAAHVMAKAVQRLVPGTTLGIGPVIENGFYYDFFRNEPFTPDDFTAIEASSNSFRRCGASLRSSTRPATQSKPVVAISRRTKNGFQAP